MSETPKLGLPEVASNQAQKHVTVNTALRLLDALVQLSVKDRSLTAPPVSPAEGDTYIVAATATGAWSGLEDYVVVWDGTAWIALEPQPGWTAWAEDEGARVEWTGAAWRAGAAASSPHGAVAGFEVREEEVTCSGATSQTTAGFIPANCTVMNVSVRVTELITGATSYSVGITGQASKFGSGLGPSVGSTNFGIIGPEGFYSDTAVLLTAAGGSFTGGKVRVAAHIYRPTPPQS